MLSKKIFAEGVKILSVLLGAEKAELDKRFNIEVWYAALSDIDSELFQKSCIYIVQNNKWHPSISEIRQTVDLINKSSKGILTIAEEQWVIFKHAVCHDPGSNKLGEYLLDRQRFFEDPITQLVAETMYVDYALSNVSEAGNWRARFISSYKNFKDFSTVETQIRKLDVIRNRLCTDQKELSND